MGLDITAYSNLALDQNPELDSDGYPVSGYRPGAAAHWAESTWPGRTEGLNNDAVYQYRDSFGFRAGSYGGYNLWRNMLAKLAGHGCAQNVWNEGAPQGPFVELINFADNEGVIGPVVSKKLAKDFADFKEQAERFAETVSDGDYFLQKYNDWHKAFTMAADSGAVDFHYY